MKDVRILNTGDDDYSNVNVEIGASDGSSMMTNAVQIIHANENSNDNDDLDDHDQNADDDDADVFCLASFVLEYWFGVYC